MSSLHACSQLGVQLLEPCILVRVGRLSSCPFLQKLKTHACPSRICPGHINALKTWQMFLIKLNRLISMIMEFTQYNTPHISSMWFELSFHPNFDITRFVDLLLIKIRNRFLYRGYWVCLNFHICFKIFFCLFTGQLELPSNLQCYGRNEKTGF